MSDRPSDFPAAAMGFFGGALLVAAVLFFISKQTSKAYEGEKAAEAQHAK